MYNKTIKLMIVCCAAATANSEALRFKRELRVCPLKCCGSEAYETILPSDC